jgi:foldase protein PrsA
VTDAQVDAAVKARGPMHTAETRDVRLVLTRRRAAARAARRALEAGESWSVVARRYSADVLSRRRGGLLRGLRRSWLEPRLARAVFRARRGRLVGPVRTSFGYYVFEVVRVHPSKLVPLARERKIIRRRLVARAEQTALNRFVGEWRARWRARTVCAPAYTWDPDCSNYDGTPVDARTRK